MGRGIAALVVVASNYASAAPAETIASVNDVRAICDSIGAGGRTRRETLATVYSVTFASPGFSFAPYDAARARVALDAGRTVRGAGFELAFHDLLGRGRPKLEIAVPVSAGDARGLAEAHDRGLLELVLWFQPADSTESICAPVRRVDSDGLRLAVEPVAFELRRGGEAVASGATPAFAALRDEAVARPIVHPQVQLAPAMLTERDGLAPARTNQVLRAHTAKLLECYRLGLADNPALEGPLVAGVTVAGDGRVVAAHAELDGLGAAQVTGCVLGELRGSRFPRAPLRFSVPMRFGSAETLGSAE